MNEPKNPNDFKYLELPEILERIQIGVEYCGKIYDYHSNKCTRIGKKYDCENCKVPEEEQKTICKAWKRVIHLTKLYHISLMLGIINAKFPEEKIPGWSKTQEKAKIILPTSQMKLF